MLSDYFDMTLDELVKDIDVQDVRNKNLTDEKVASIYLDVENVKNNFKKFAKIFCYADYFRLYFTFAVSRYRMALGKHPITVGYRVIHFSSPAYNGANCEKRIIWIISLFLTKW